MPRDTSPVIPADILGNLWKTAFPPMPAWDPKAPVANVCLPPKPPEPAPLPLPSRETDKRLILRVAERYRI